MDEKGEEGDQPRTAAYDEESVVVAYAEGVSVGSSDEEYVPDLLFPEGCADGSPLLDDYSGFALSMDG